jgi:hypothetical protein
LCYNVPLLARPPCDGCPTLCRVLQCCSPAVPSSGLKAPVLGTPVCVCLYRTCVCISYSP